MDAFAWYVEIPLCIDWCTMPYRDDQVCSTLQDDKDTCKDDSDAEWSLWKDPKEADQNGELAQLLDDIVEDLTGH